MNDFLSILSNKSNQDVYSFWHFFFDEPHPMDSIPRYIENFESEHPVIYKSANSALIDVKEKWSKY
ncbi:MAG: hypothetical protein K9G58_03945 [Bacteroidales bacterium]|nr:hypothetical protein [Bacteroidales bacterium]MCF8387622.1 hypothetical protein [Bacteroidales bacterium]MCF8397297.1 hypothetical protein [Bacteroidales bacterium]